MSSTATITDYVLWTRHVHGDPAIAHRLSCLKAGETVGLRIEGKLGTWRKMDDGKDGRPTPGLRPVGIAQDIWRNLYKSRRGDVVPIELADEPPVVAAMPEVIGRMVRTDAERQAALEALLSPSLWKPDPAYVFERDETHEL